VCTLLGLSCSILLWHRSDNLAFAIIAGGSVQPGEGVECKIRGILQVSTAQHNAPQHGTARHSTAQHGTARHSTAQHDTAWHSMAQCNAAQCTTARRNAVQHKEVCCDMLWPVQCKVLCHLRGRPWLLLLLKSLVLLPLLLQLKSLVLPLLLL
jgi:hypothetical protein